MKKLSQLFLPVFITFLFIGAPLASIADNDGNGLENSLDKFRQSRQEFRNAKAQEANEKFQESKAKSLSETAKEKREEATKAVSEKRKNVLLGLIDIQIKHFERTGGRIEKMSNITREFKDELNAKIGEVLQGLADEKITIENAQTPEEIKALVSDIKESFKSYRKIVKNIVDAILASRVEKAIDKAEKRLDVIAEKVQRLKDRGKDMSEIEKSIDGARNFIENIRGGMGRKTFKETLKDLKDAYQQIRGLIKTVNEIK